MIGIIGAGNMGEALIKGILSAGGADIIVSDASEQRRQFLKKNYKVAVLASNEELVRQSDIVILAVKPETIDAVLSEIRAALNEKKQVISIAAGITTGHIEKRLNKKTSVIRAMPNMPALIGKGISAICSGKFTKPADKQDAIKILSSVGKVVEVEESLMNVVTAISGSGPAYFFFLIEELINAAIGQGLSEETAQELAVQTAFGAASLILETKEDPRLLRQKVTSKGGTTEAAFAVFQRAGLDDILHKAVEAAVKRSKELSR